MDRPLLDRLLVGRAGSDRGSPVTHVENIASRPPLLAGWPSWVPAPLRDGFAAMGIAAPWRHQVEAAELARAGTSVVVATGTASGKSLGYQLPVLSALLEDRKATGLYLAPTKALAADQLRSLHCLGLSDVRACSYDGDTSYEDRDWVRRFSRLVLTNPDMLHAGILPGHQKWSTFLRRLRYVVIDECHTYRGVFGSHIAQVLRRLRRICRRYGSDPAFLLASATVSDPAVSASRLTGVPVHAVTRDSSGHGPITFALWEPPLTELTAENGAPVRRSANAEAARVLADLMIEGSRTLVFVTSRRGAEAVAIDASRMLAETAPELAASVEAYRSGYLPEERREIERAIVDGRLRGVAATSALELGIDIAGLDAVVLAGFPGTIASLWQQAGRAGRSGQDSLAVLIARDDPLDTYLVHHPDALFGKPVEITVLDPDNPYVLAPHLLCAASELPLTPEDLETFGRQAAATVDALTNRGQLRRRPAGWYWVSRTRPQVDIRGTGGRPVPIVEAATGRVLGSVDADRAETTVHAGAVYVHRGVCYQVTELIAEERTDSGSAAAEAQTDSGSAALVRADDPDWSTSARETTDIRVVSPQRQTGHGSVRAFLGTVDVRRQVVSYVRRRASGAIIDETPLDFPMHELRTRAIWYTVDEATLGAAGIAPADIPGAAHAAEHAAIGLMPLIATCDRWDVGGMSTALHADTGRPTVFVYDGHPGGAGFADRGFEALSPWLRATRDAIAGCECDAGCPSCIHSPKCGNGNEPLHKQAAIRLLGVVLDQLG